MGKYLEIPGADYSSIAVGKVTPVVVPVAPPAITITSGSVTLTTAEGNSIYYTTDGSTPSASSTKYTSAFVVQNGTTIKAIAISADNETSNISVKKYSILLSQLTLVSGLALNSDGYTIPWETESDTRVSTHVTDVTGVGSITLTPKTGYKFAIYYGTGGNNGERWTYHESATTFNFTGCTKIGIMIAPTASAPVTSTDWDTYMTES